MTYPIVQGDHVFLRAVEMSDLDRCLRWVADSEVTQYLLIGRFPINRLREEEWLSNLYKSQSAVHFAVCKVEDSAHIGVCALHDIDWVDRFATLGILIGDKGHWGRGLGTEAIGLLGDYAFKVLNLNRLELAVFDFNDRATRSYTKLGFHSEGRLRSKRFKNGRYCDEILMGVLAPEWRIPASTTTQDPAHSDRGA